jgi:hypothetical protein
MAYLRFHRRISLSKWLRLNVNRKSISLTAGKRRGGPHFTVSSNGSTTSSVGMPGTGASIVHRTRPGGFRRLWNRIVVAAGKAQS